MRLEYFWNDTDPLWKLSDEETAVNGDVSKDSTRPINIQQRDPDRV